MNEMQSCAGISLTSSKLQFIEIEKESDLLQVVNCGQIFFSPQIDFELQDESIVRDQLQTAFDEIKIRHPISSNNISFALPPELFITHQLPYDSNLNQNEIRDEYMWELSEMFPHISIDDLALKIYELDNTLLPGKNNALVVALNKKYLLMIKQFCQANKLNPKLVDNSSIAANTFLNTKFLNNINPVRINIFDSKNMITLFINVSSKPAFVRTFGKHKKDYVSKIVNELFDDKIKSTLQTSSFEAIVSGEEPEPELVYQLEKVIGSNLKKLNPFEVLKFKDESNNNSLLADDFTVFTSVVGIASRFN